MQVAVDKTDRLAGGRRAALRAVHHRAAEAHRAFAVSWTLRHLLATKHTRSRDPQMARDASQPVMRSLIAYGH
jgi:hypothetical protein